MTIEPADFKSVYGQLMAASTLGGGPSPGQEAALRDLDGIMAAAEHVIRGVPVGAGAHSTICALLMDAYAKGQQSRAAGREALDAYAQQNADLHRENTWLRDENAELRQQVTKRG